MLVLCNRTATPSKGCYNLYGDTRGGSEVVSDYRYTGQRWQSALGLDYYRARWYDPQMRRFVQADTIVPEPGVQLAQANCPTKWHGHFVCRER